MDDALAIRDYLPNSFKNQNDGDYIAFLWEVFESNYESEKYQFAMLAYHMLYMSFVYFSVWQIKLSRPADFANAVIFQQKEKELLTASSPFTFSEVQERSIFKFLRLAGCEQQHIGQFQKLVDERNDIAHSNGHIFFTDQAVADRKIGEIMGQMAAIQSHMRPVIHDCLKRFLLESHNPDEREYYDDADQIQEVLIHVNYFSQKDTEACRSFDIGSLAGDANFEAIKALFEAFLAKHPPTED
ncbi:MAG: hypothetical protein KGZ83_17780 [Sulfuricella sp.]|nr:hypothetical protein [Sulfuricella sp.]